MLGTGTAKTVHLCPTTCPWESFFAANKPSTVDNGELISTDLRLFAFICGKKNQLSGPFPQPFRNARCQHFLRLTADIDTDVAGGDSHFRIVVGPRLLPEYL